MKEKMEKKSVRTGTSGQIAEGKITVTEAFEKWNEKFPKAPITKQTIRNWSLKYGLGEKNTFLPRSIWIIDKEKFEKFLENPKKFLISIKKS